MLSKEKKIQFIKDKLKNKEFTAYDIGKNTSVDNGTVNRIVNGITKNPNEQTLDAIIHYMDYGSKAQEPDPIYAKQKPSEKSVPYYNVDFSIR